MWNEPRGGGGRPEGSARRFRRARMRGRLGDWGSGCRASLDPRLVSRFTEALTCVPATRTPPVRSLARPPLVAVRPRAARPSSYAPRGVGRMWSGLGGKFSCGGEGGVGGGIWCLLVTCWVGGGQSPPLGSPCVPHQQGVRTPRKQCILLGGARPWLEDCRGVGRPARRHHKPTALPTPPNRSQPLAWPRVGGVGKGDAASGSGVGPEHDFAHALW
ncbi:hypothetical protein Tco_0825385 [Tanacetum coccineum]